MTVFVADRDFILHLGDVREILPRFDAGSVDCVVTSPPYWGLRDYGTGGWDGGDPDCDHRDARRSEERAARKFADGKGAVGQSLTSWTTRDETVKTSECPKGCGARRVDTQIGLEATPDLYVAELVAVFREVRRVLAPHGTCWVNLGDSYASGGGLGAQGESGQMADRSIVRARRAGVVPGEGGNQSGARNRDGTPSTHGLKPKDLVGIPWRVAFALQADGWWLRSDIVWSKPNPMPESVTDRPTKSHEYVFLLSKGPRYFFDQEAVREPHQYDGRIKTVHDHAVNGSHENYANMGTAQERWPNGGRNVRSVWEIATQPYPEAHFATFPEALPERCIKAGCPEGGVVLDPFMGSGTVALVARRLGRRSIGVELSPEYAELAARRLQQLSLLAEQPCR